MDRSIGIAVTGIERDLRDAAEPAIAAGFSQGAIAVAYAKKALMALSADQRPAPDRLTFVTIGDPTGAGGILRTLHFRVPLIHLTPFAPPDTPYDTVIVNGEYDGWADFPDRQWNLVSVVNALLGTIYVHGGYETIPGGLDLSTVPLANITTTVNSLGGTTTTYLLPTEKLPLVQPLRDIGVSERIVTAIEKSLKRVVDKGYLRNDAAQAKIAQSTPPSTAKGPVPATPAPREIRNPERRAAAGSPRRTALRSSGRSAAAA
ncbi:MAG: PE-PPE domain-containing protein [Mycobacterium sp.]|nr:PE-PPE domain-containing protein [Mycobacterium sp.]